MTYDHIISFEAPEGYLENVTGHFIVNIEDVEPEPYTYGWRRGIHPEATSATLESIRLGGLEMPREWVEQWLGMEAVDLIENTVLAAMNDNPELMVA